MSGSITTTTTAAASLPAAGVAATAGLQAITAPVIPQGAQVLTVGVGKEYATVGAAIGAAGNGAVILVDAGTYTNDFATVTSKITLIGVGGMVNMVATEPPPNFKGILTIDNDVNIQNFSFSGCAIPTAEGGNGAGIRYEGGQMVLVNDVFTNNQNGVMGGPVCGLAVNTVSIDHCVFSSNGSGSGYTHNIYMGALSSVTATNSIFEYANVGHDFKSRALSNTISGNIFRDGPTGTASYNIDLPNGGNDTVTNNIIEKGPDASNSAMVHFGGEGIPYAGSALTVSGNQFQNDLGNLAVGVLNQTAISANITGNAFVNFSGATLAEGPATETGNMDGTGTLLPNSMLQGVLPGSTLVITDDQQHSVALGGTLEAVEGGAGLLTAYAYGGHVVVIGGSGGVNFFEAPSSGGNQITTAAGSTNLLQLTGYDSVDSEGNDTISVGSLDVKGVVNGNATIYDGTAQDQWTVNGTATITGTGGSPVISAGSSADVVVNGTLTYLGLTTSGGPASVDVTTAGTEDVATTTTGALNLKVYGGAMYVTTAAGSQGATITFGSGAAQVMSNGSDTIFAGSGSETIVVTSNAQVYAGTGTLALYGRGACGATLFGNGGTYLIGGDTGDITYQGGTLNSTVDLQLSHNTIVGGSGTLTVNGGSAETLLGGSGGMVYNATDNGGGNTITTAAGSSNALNLYGPDVINSWGTDTINGGVANQTMAIHGNSVVTDSTGNSSFTFYGNDTLIGQGTDSVAVEAGADLKVYAGTLTSVTEAGGIVRFRVGSPTGGTTARATVSGGSATVYNKADGSIAVTTSTGNASNVSLGVGKVAVSSLGADTIQAGAGLDTITINANNAMVSGGNGTLVLHNYDWTSGDQVTVKAGSGTVQYDQGPGKLTFIGGSGSAVINGAYGSLNIQGGSGNLTVTGGSSGETFVAGSGNASVALTSGGGNITFGVGSTSVQEAGFGAAAQFNFVAGQGGGTDVITGFRAGLDQLVFQGVSVASEQTGSAGPNAAISGSQSMPTGTILTLTDGTHVDLAGFTSSPHAFS